MSTPKHTNIGELRQAISTVVKMLANRGINVTQQGMSAFVHYDEKTLQPTRVNIPSISDNSSDDLVTAIKGFVDHEVGHLLFTDANILKRAVKEKIANLHNIVEDTFIEAEMKKMFAGSVRNLDKTVQFAIKHFFQKTFDKYIDDHKKDGDEASQARFFINALATPGIRALAGQEAAQDFMQDKWEFVPDVYDALKPLSHDLEGVSSSLQALKLANTIRDLLCEVEQEEKDKKAEKEKAEEDKTDRPEGSDEEECDDADEGDAEEGEGDGDGEGGEEGEGEEGEGDVNHSPDEILEGDDDGEGTEGGEVDHFKEDADESGDGDTDDAESRDSDEEKEKGGLGDKKGEDADGKDEKEKTDGKGAEDNEDGGESSDGDSSSSEAADSGNDYSDPDDLSDEVNESKRTTDERDEDSEASEDSAAATSNDGTIADHEDLLDDLENVDTFDKALEDAISEAAVNGLDSMSYQPYSSADDLIELHKVPENRKDNARNSAQRMKAENQNRIGAMSKSLERMMMARNRSMYVPGYRSGRLHTSGLYKIKTGDTRVFRRKEEVRTKNTAVMLLVDCSGSMNTRDRIVKAAEAAYALCSSLERINIPTQVMGFTTGTRGNSYREAYTEMEALQAKYPGKKMTFDRIEPLLMPIFKTFDERLTPDSEMRIASIPMMPLRNNADGECVEIAANVLRTRQEERKILVVLSDGQPAMMNLSSESFGSSQRANEHLEQVVKDVEASGIETLGIGIETHDVRAFYPKSIVIDKVAELPGKVISELSSMLLV